MLTECDANTKTIMLKENPKYYIKRVNKIVTEENEKKFNHKKVKLNMYEIQEINFFHSKILIDVFDPV